MNLDYRSTQCSLGKITSFFPGTQNWAVFQWTITLPGMLTGMCVCVSAALLKQLNAGKSTLKGMYLPFLHGQPFPHRITSQAQSTSYHIYFNYGINIFFKSQHKFLSINMYIYMHTYICILFVAFSDESITRNIQNYTLKKEIWSIPRNWMVSVKHDYN